MRRLVFAAMCLLLAVPVQARTLYPKVAGGSWTNAATWSTTSGCVGVDNSGPPTGADDVIIEYCGLGSGAIVIDTFSTPAVVARTVFVAPSAQLSATQVLDGTGTLTWPSLTLGLATTGTIWSADPAAVLNLGNLQMTICACTTGQTVTFNGGGLAYGSLLYRAGTFGIGSLRLVGANTFDTISVGATPFFMGTATIQLPAGQTTTIQNLITSSAVFGLWGLASDTPGMPATLFKTSGTISVDYLTVTDIAATGNSTTWCAYNASANGGGNTGWTYTACPTSGSMLIGGVSQ